MRLKSIIIIFNIFFIMMTGHSQITQKELIRFNLFANETIKTVLLKDSVAFYACNLQIRVDRKSSYIPTISTNDSALVQQILDLEAFRNYDYKPLMGKMNQVKFILPISIVIYDSKSNSQNFNSQIAKQLAKLFYTRSPDEDPGRIFYLDRILQSADKKIYY